MRDAGRAHAWRRLFWLAVLPCLQCLASPREGLVLEGLPGNAGLRLEEPIGCARSALRLEAEANVHRAGAGLVLNSAVPPMSYRMDGALRQLIEVAAANHGLDAALVQAVVRVESAFNPHVVSNKGAMGLMQIMPATARGLGVADPARALFDPITNLSAGTRHLRALHERYPGRVDLAIAAYNAGEGAVARWAGIPPYRETQQYVQKVLFWYEAYRSGESAVGQALASTVRASPAVWLARANDALVRKC